MALQRPTTYTSMPICGKQGFYGLLPSASATSTSLITPKPTFLDPGLSIGETVDCVIYRRSEDADPRVLSRSMWATYKKGRPTMEKGWSAHTGLGRLISDSEGRVVASVVPCVWDEWVSELQQDTRTLLPGYSLSHAVDRYVRFDQEG